MELPYLKELLRPQILHAASVHFPIVFALVGIPLVYLAAVSANEKNTLLWLSIVCYGLFTITALIAAQMGERAMALVPPDINSEVSKVLHRHEEMAEKAWIAGLGLTLVLLLTLVRKRLFRSILMVIAMMGSLVLGIWLVVVAHLGGTLVYVHGVGTPGFAGKGTIADPSTSGAKEDTETPRSEDSLIPIRQIDPQAAAEISYKRDIKPLFERYCIDCHGATSPKGGISLVSVDAMRLQGRKAGPGIVPGKPDQSSIVRYVRGELRPRMPKGQAPLSESDVHVIRAWISAGALDDSLETAPPTSQSHGEAAPEQTSP